MRLRPSSYFLFAILLVSLAVVIRSAAFEHIDLKLLPIIVASLIFCLAVIALIRELGKKEEKVTRGPEVESDDIGKVEAEETEVEKSRYIWVACWLAGFALLSYLVGFLISIPLFIFSYLKTNGRGWLVTSVVAGIMLAFVYGIFELALQIELYRGLLFFW